jgi:hypothetical protein
MKVVLYFVFILKNASILLLVHWVVSNNPFFHDAVFLLLCRPLSSASGRTWNHVVGRYWAFSNPSSWQHSSHSRTATLPTLQQVGSENLGPRTRSRVGFWRSKPTFSKLLQIWPEPAMWLRMMRPYLVSWRHRRCSTINTVPRQSLVV